jgi:acetolactate synthase-1/2/3 large subunit
MVGHWIAAVHALPILTIVFNNSRYGAVRRATLSMFKDGVAGENDGRTLADLDPSPAYEVMAQAQGAYAERVEKPADLPDALTRAREAVVNGRRQALLNVITPY